MRKKYYSAVKNNDIKKFADKWMELEKTIILSEVPRTRKKSMCVLTYLILAVK